MKRILILIAVLVFVAGLTTAALAQHGQGMKAPRAGARGHFDKGGFGGHCGILGCQQELGLTDDQTAKIKELSFAHQNAMIDLKAELKKAQLKMKQDIHAEGATKSDALAAAREINAIKGKISEAQIGHKFDLKGVLNKEQLEKWTQCQMQCGGKCGPGGGHGFKGHPGGRMRHDPGCPKWGK